MRPAGAVSADGPINLLQAIQVARTPASYNKGVLVVMNGYIDGARDVTKMNTTNVATFGSPNAGHLGIVQDGIAQYYMCPLRKHTMDLSLACQRTMTYHVLNLNLLCRYRRNYGACHSGNEPNRV